MILGSKFNKNVEKILRKTLQKKDTYLVNLDISFVKKHLWASFKVLYYNYETFVNLVWNI